nr:hypothetical protein [Tanacetum cinerariifolium]
MEMIPLPILLLEASPLLHVELYYVISYTFSFIISLRLAGFLEAAAGTAEEQVKNFQWGLCRSTLNHLMCILFTDVAQVANAA